MTNSISPSTTRDSVSPHRPPDESPYLELCFRSTLETIATTRKYVSMIFEPLLDDADRTSRLGMAAHEMLENAHKYSPGGETLLMIEFSRGAPPAEIRIGTRNRIADDARTSLDELFAAMNAARDAMAHYQNRMKLASVRKTGSGLGLARIWAEGEMTITHKYKDDYVWIWSTMRLTEGTQ